MRLSLFALTICITCMGNYLCQNTPRLFRVRLMLLLALLHVLMAASHARMTQSATEFSLTAARIGWPSIGTSKTRSCEPRSISLVTVTLNPFHETRKPREHRPFRFSIFSLNSTSSFFPHFDIQSLHSTRIQRFFPY